MGDFQKYNDPRYEENLSKRIDKGQLDDADIAYVENHGDRSLKNQLESKHREIYEKKQYQERAYGLKFDGVDEDGNPYQDLRIDPNSIM